MPPDTISALFPDRPIRPLPKRRLREKLSPEAADFIQFPSTSFNPTPFFRYPSYPDNGDVKYLEDKSLYGDNFKLSGEVAALDGNARPSLHEQKQSNSASLPIRTSTEPILYRLDQPRTADTAHIPSATSSVDGYDSLENANNKKKRKIPSAGESTINTFIAVNNGINIPSGPIREIDANHAEENLPLSRGDDKFLIPGIYYSQSISGVGRGRLGRSRNGRYPLQTISDGLNARHGNELKYKFGQSPSSEGKPKYAVPKAVTNAEGLPTSDQENLSVMQQNGKPRLTTSQFKFTFDTESQLTVQWPGHTVQDDEAIPNGVRSDLRSSTTSVPPRSGRGPRRASRHSIDSELQMAARHRREIAAENFYHNRPKLDDIWICEFCEYERIFGVPPRTLIREYEMQDRQLRLEEADRKRLLEKAKAKRRKNRRNGKTNKTQPSPDGTNEHSQSDILEADAPSMQTGNSRSTELENGVRDEVEYGDPNHVEDIFSNNGDRQAYAVRRTSGT